jgi:E3 ubiquitin-protein ligase RNF14
MRLPPEISSIRASHLWLPGIEQLQAALLAMWQAGEPLLYNWVEYIRTGDFLEKMNLLSSTNNDIIV